MRLYAPYLRRIITLRISPELRSRVDVSDVVQETQLAIVRRIDEFLGKRPASFRVWLRGRAIEQVVDQYRRHVRTEKRSVRRETDMYDVSSIAIARTLFSNSPSKMLQKRELIARIRELIEGLSETDREILTLRHAEGLSNSEAAEALDLNLEATRKRYGRALRRLVEKVTLAGLDVELSWDQAK